MLDLLKKVSKPQTIHDGDPRSSRATCPVYYVTLKDGTKYYLVCKKGTASPSTIKHSLSYRFPELIDQLGSTELTFVCNLEKLSFDHIPPDYPYYTNRLNDASAWRWIRNIETGAVRLDSGNYRNPVQYGYKRIHSPFAHATLRRHKLVQHRIVIDGVIYATIATAVKETGIQEPLLEMMNHESEHVIFADKENIRKYGKSEHLTIEMTKNPSNGYT